MGKVGDRCLEFIESTTDADTLEAWRDTNAVALRQYWTERKSEALEIKKQIERRISQLREQAA